ncbi:hypothetical protein M514_02161 [Trichuris suis]|uniref:Uncharacterized protein n=1 Tax=Trichuris suis TaxID=68888 RepID=A0A085MI58_9BILA|nr:hypothetical protein M513_02161 [Trichuris suis]KFD66140.1 hypothetical protein M514_02161 [Trichuris suis]
MALTLKEVNVIMKGMEKGETPKLPNEVLEKFGKIQGRIFQVERVPPNFRTARVHDTGTKQFSTMVEHAMTCAQALMSLSASTLLHEPHFRRTKIMESLYIGQKRSINKDDGLGVSEAWLPLTASTIQLCHNAKT